MIIYYIEVSTTFHILRIHLVVIFIFTYFQTYLSNSLLIQCSLFTYFIDLWFIIIINYYYHIIIITTLLLQLLFCFSRYFSEQASKREGFRLILKEPQCTNVCFWFIPKSLRDQEETPKWWQKLSKVKVWNNMCTDMHTMSHQLTFWRPA